MIQLKLKECFPLKKNLFNNYLANKMYLIMTINHINRLLQYVIKIKYI